MSKMKDNIPIKVKKNAKEAHYRFVIWPLSTSSTHNCSSR